MTNGLLTRFIGGVIVALLLAWVSFMVGQGTLDSRVTVLETNWTHLKEKVDDIHRTVHKLLGNK